MDLIKKPWTRKVWIEKRNEVLNENSECLQCHTKEQLQIHHKDRKYCAEKYDEYASLADINYMILCKKCHFNLHKGYLLCLVCKIHYKKLEYDTCFHCLNPEDREKVSKKHKEHGILGYRPGEKLPGWIK